MPTVLAVDDSATMRRCLEIAFSGTGIGLVCCATPAAALEQVAVVRPDLVLVDASLPPSDGYDLCSALQAFAPGIPVLLLTSKQHPFDSARGAGVAGHVDKPFETHALLDAVQAAIARHPKPLASARPRPVPALMKTMAFGTSPEVARPKDPSPAAPPPPPPAASAPRLRTSPAALGGHAPDFGDIDDIDTAAGPEPKAGKSAPHAAPDASSAPDTKRFVHATPAPAPVMPTVARSTSAAAVTPAAVTPAVALDASFTARLRALGLDDAQVAAVVTLSRDVIERVAREIVPALAESIIRDELRRLTKE